MAWNGGNLTSGHMDLAIFPGLLSRYDGTTWNPPVPATGEPNDMPGHMLSCMMPAGTSTMPNGWNGFENEAGDASSTGNARATNNTPPILT